MKDYRHGLSRIEPGMVFARPGNFSSKGGIPPVADFRHRSRADNKGGHPVLLSIQVFLLFYPYMCTTGEIKIVSNNN